MHPTQPERDRRYLHTPRGRYQQQKRRATQRGVGWQISFVDWWAIWQASGKWSLRGNHKGCYCMGRLLDQGAYRVGNVEIVPYEQNSADNNTYRRWTSRVGGWFDLAA